VARSHFPEQEADERGSSVEVSVQAPPEHPGTPRRIEETYIRWCASYCLQLALSRTR
jgi:hypothetical protein